MIETKECRTEPGKNGDMPEIKAGEATGTGIWYRLSRVISILMHPFAMPTYMVVFMLFSGTVMSYIAPKEKLMFIAIVLLNTAVVPALFIGLMKSAGYLREISLDDPRERIVPLLVTAVCYSVCAYMVPDNYLVFLVRKFLIAGTACIIAALIVTWSWKISLHMIAVGAAFAILLILNVSWQGLGVMLVPLIMLTLLGGMLASARLMLGAHTPAQVGAGFLLGFAVTCAIVLFS